MELHENIRSLRKERGWSQQHLAELVGYGDRSSIAKIAKVFNVTPAYLLGYSEETDALILSIIEENESGRTAAVDEIRRLFGTDRSIHNVYACADKKKATILYYKTLDRYVVLSLSNILGTVDDLDKHQAEKVMLLLHAYLKAEQPIRNIVDTALDPYMEDLDELLYGGSQIG